MSEPVCDPAICSYARGYYDRSDAAVAELLAVGTMTRAAIETVARDPPGVSVRTIPRRRRVVRHRDLRLQLRVRPGRAAQTPRRHHRRSHCAADRRSAPARRSRSRRVVHRVRAWHDLTRPWRIVGGSGEVRRRTGSPHSASSGATPRVRSISIATRSNVASTFRSRCCAPRKTIARALTTDIDSRSNDPARHRAGVRVAAPAAHGSVVRRGSFRRVPAWSRQRNRDRSCAASTQAPRSPRRLSEYRAHIRFSATVSPFEMTGRAHGQPDARTLRLPSPFPPERLGVFVVPDVSTLFRQREANAACARQASSKR